MSDFKQKISPKNMNTEQWFLECFQKYKGRPLVTLVALYKGNYHKFVLAIFFFLMKHLGVWVLPLLTAEIINDIVAKEADVVGRLYVYGAVLVGLFILNVPMNYLYTAYKSKATRYAETGLRKVLICKLQHLSINYHRETQSGRLQSKIMRDVEAVETLSTQLFLNIINIALNIIIALCVTLKKSKMVFVFLLVTTPIAAAILYLFRNSMKKRNTEFRVEMENTSAKVMEMMQLIPVTRAHALEDEEIEKMSRQLFSVAEKGYRLDLVQALFGSVGWAIFQVFQVGCLIFTAILALHNQIEVGDITLYQTYFATIVNQVTTIMTLLPIITKGTESVNSIGEVLLSDDIEENEGKKPIEEVTGDFVFKKVCFAYPNQDKDVLRGLDLHVEAGETIAFVGESGAGKSTILNLVIGFDKATDGQVLLDGMDMSEMDLRSYRKYLAVVPQTSILFSGTVRDNITYGAEHVTEDELWAAIRAANLEDVIKKLPHGLDTKVGEHGNMLSGGQRQRVSIARALLRNPKVIVLDEATSALDSISEKKIQEAINNLSTGRTTFIVAHRLSTIRDADKIAVISDGKCVEYGTYDELVAQKGYFYKMKMIQS